MIALRQIVIPLYLFLCLILGGASNGGFFANWLLQVLGVLLLAWAFWSHPQPIVGPRRRSLVALLAGFVVLVLLQFVPIPEALWLMSPGRAALAEEGALAGITYAPLFWGLLPHEAVKSALWALPALALGAALLRLPHWNPAHLAWAIIAAMVLSVIIGAVQTSQGDTSPAYIYAITNRGLTVGFFANANHLATLLLVSIPFIAALMAQNRQIHKTTWTPFLAIVIGLLVVALTGIFVNGSRAGVALVGPVLAASVMICFATPIIRKSAVIGFPLLLGGALLWLFNSQQGEVFLALENAASTGNRMSIWGRTWAAIGDFMPLGSGLGTFAEVFRRFEDPAAVMNVYINHAHNDYLELLLEFGLLAVPVLGAFLLWWGARAGRIWLTPSANPFARAAVVASAVILVHEIVDYPLRTAGISSLFVAGLVMMTMWVTGDGYLQIAARHRGTPSPDADKAE